MHSTRKFREILVFLKLVKKGACIDYDNVIVIVPVVLGGAGGAMAPPDLGRSVNPISIKGGKLCLPNNTGPESDTKVNQTSTKTMTMTLL